MPRYIDADAFIKEQCNSCDGACEALPCDCINCDSDCRCDMIKDLQDAPTVSPDDVLGVDQDKVLVLPGDLTVAALTDMYNHANECGEADSVENWTTGYRAGRKAGYVELLRLILGVEKDEVSEDDGT